MFRTREWERVTNTEPISDYFISLELIVLFTSGFSDLDLWDTPLLFIGIGLGFYKELGWNEQGLLEGIAASAASYEASFSRLGRVLLTRFGYPGLESLVTCNYDSMYWAYLTGPSWLWVKEILVPTAVLTWYWSVVELWLYIGMCV